jgi:hypothetical protein
MFTLPFAKELFIIRATPMRILSLFLLLFSTAALRAAEISVTDLTAKPSGELKVSGAAADKVLREFKNLAWDGTPGARCHHPAYRITNPASGKAEFDVTVCFACWNVRFLIPEKPLAGFKKDSDSARKLQETLSSLFAKR